MSPDAVQSITVTAPPPHQHPAWRPAWRTFLSELNPLQYLPVVGTIYRAVTGDTIPDAVREAGSLAVSFATGGPVGLGISLGASVIEHALGIDPERLGTHLLAELGIGSARPDPPPPALPQPAAPPVQAARAWSATELAAYGVQRSAAGELRRGTTSGADVLNGLELGRLHALA